MLKVWGRKDSSNVQKVVWCCDELGVAFERIDIAGTLFVVSSKSGSTLETLSLFEYFWEQTGHNGDQFVAITDEGSYLDGLSQDRGIRRIFRNQGDIG